MSLRLDKLESLLDDKDLNIVYVIVLRKYVVFINVQSATTLTSFMIYVPQKFRMLPKTNKRVITLVEDESGFSEYWIDLRNKINLDFVVVSDYLQFVGDEYIQYRIDISAREEDSHGVEINALELDDIVDELVDEIKETPQLDDAPPVQSPIEDIREDETIAMDSDDEAILKPSISPPAPEPEQPIEGEFNIKEKIYICISVFMFNEYMKENILIDKIREMQIKMRRTEANLRANSIKTLAAKFDRLISTIRTRITEITMLEEDAYSYQDKLRMTWNKFLDVEKKGNPEKTIAIREKIIRTMKENDEKLQQYKYRANATLSMYYELLDNISSK